MKITRKMKENKELIIYLTKNDFKNKFAGSYFGIIWAFVQPITTIALYWFVFEVGLRSGSVGEVPFVLWLMAGLIPWFYYQEALVNSNNVFLEYSYLVKKVVFNIDILPIVKAISSLYVHGFFVLLMVAVYATMGYYTGLILLQLAYYSLCMIVLVIGLGYTLSAINIFFKDTMQILSVYIQIGTWMTPILWNINDLPERFVWIFKLNPMFYIVQGYRDTMIDGVWFYERWALTSYFWIFVIIICLLGKVVYTKLKPHFSDSL